ETKEQTHAGNTYHTSLKNKQSGQPLTGCFVDDRTVLIAPEQTLRKMLAAAAGSKGPVADQLRKMNWEGDALAVVLVEPFRSMATEFAKQVGPALPPPLAEATSLPARLKLVR